MSILSALLYLSILHTTLAVEPRELLYADCKLQQQSGYILNGCYSYKKNIIIVASDPYKMSFDWIFLHEFAHDYAYQKNVQQYEAGYGFENEEDMANTYPEYYRNPNELEKKSLLKYQFFHKYFPIW